MKIASLMTINLVGTCRALTLAETFENETYAESKAHIAIVTETRARGFAHLSVEMAVCALSLYAVAELKDVFIIAN